MNGTHSVVFGSFDSSKTQVAREGENGAIRELREWARMNGTHSVVFGSFDSSKTQVAREGENGANRESREFSRMTTVCGVLLRVLTA
jgi:hypothetical protein